MDNTLHIKIYKATDTFLYLPVYIAEDLGILETILEDTYNGYKFDFEFITPENKGDEGAISQMLQNTNENTIAIAIGSPVAFLSNEKKFEDVKVVGAIINKLTFWALAKDNHSKSINGIADFGSHFENIIYPNDKYVTAHYLGKKVEKEAKINNSFSVEFGTEINNSDGKNKVVVLTADIFSLATAMSSDNPYRFHINYSFPKKEGEFLTTGIITSKASCERFPNIIEKIVDSIQMSVAVFYTSKKTAVSNCMAVAKRLRCDNIDEKSIRRIVDLMYDEEFYPKHDLRVTRESWGEAVKAFLQGTTTEKENAFFEKYVNNDFVLKSTTKRLSIDLDAPRNTTPCKKYTNGGCPKIALLEKQLKELQEKEHYYVEWLWKATMFFKGNKTILIIMLSLIAILVANQHWSFIPHINEGTNFLMTLVSLIVGVIGLKINKWIKDSKKGNNNDE